VLIYGSEIKNPLNLSNYSLPVFCWNKMTGSLGMFLLAVRFLDNAGLPYILETEDVIRTVIAIIIAMPIYSALSDIKYWSS